MKRFNSFSKGLCLILLVSVFFTACDVPDISKFSEQSAEMTRGIRQAVKDTGGVLKTASESNHLFETETIDAFKQHSKNYDAAMQPTLEALDALDAYLDALNALAQANKKSAENSKAVVGAVSSLVTSTSQLVLIGKPDAALQLPETALNIATGLIATFEQFRTAKSFKKRVNLAADIVEGRYEEISKEVMVNGQSKKIVEYKKVCTDANRADIERIGRQLTQTLKSIDSNNAYTDDQKETLKESARKNFDNDAYKYGCGVIDLLKFTMKDLKKINNLVSGLMQRNFSENNKETIALYKNLDKNNLLIQQELSLILKYKNFIAEIKDLKNQSLAEEDANQRQILSREIRRKIKKNKEDLDGIVMLHGRIKEDLMTEIVKCDNGSDKKRCAQMRDFVELSSTDDANEARLNNLYQNIPLDNFFIGNSYIESILDNRRDQLFASNEAHLAQKARINPDYERVTGDLAEMIKKQKRLDGALSASIVALNTWNTTHANLRVAVNTKKPLSVGNLTAKVKEIWATFEPTAE